MAKKKEAAQEIPAQAITVDGCEVLDLQNVIIDEIEYIKGYIGTYQFLWFTDGKRSNGIECEKDLI